MAKKINLRKAVWTTFFWTVAYFSVVIYYVYKDLGINLLSAADLQTKYYGFIYGQWSLDSNKTILLIASLFLFFPVWIFGAMTFYKINWKMPRLFKRSERSFKKQLLIKPQDGKLRMPVKLQLKSSGYTPASTPLSAPVMTTPPAQDDTVLSAVEKDDAIPQYANLLQLARQYHVDIFENTVLDNLTVPVAISKDDEDLAVLMTFIGGEQEHYSVNIEDGLDGDWYGTMAPIESPAAFIKEAADRLKALEENAQIIPVVVITAGQIEEADEVARFLKESGVELLRFSNGGPESLTSVKDFFDQLFDRA